MDSMAGSQFMNYRTEGLGQEPNCRDELNHSWGVSLVEKMDSA